MEQWGGRKRGGIFAGGCIFAGSIFGGKRLRAPLSLAQTTNHPLFPPPTPLISICPWVFGVSVGRLGLEKSFIEKVCVCESG